MLSNGLLCLIPAERVQLTEAVLVTGAIPVIDITCSERVAIPAGAWVRTRTRRSVPGTGPVILVGAHTQPVKGRPTWLEVTAAQGLPEGFAGLVLRGIEAGGPCAARPGMALLQALPAGTPAILEAGCSPEDASAAMAAGAKGVMLSDVLLAQPAMKLPP